MVETSHAPSSNKHSTNHVPFFLHHAIKAMLDVTSHIDPYTTEF